MKLRFLLVYAGLGLLAAAPFAVAQAPGALDVTKLKLGSANVVVFDAAAKEVVYAKSADDVTPIASLTKLMTAMVTLDANLPLDERIAIDSDDQDLLKGSQSRLRIGSELARRDMLRLALMASENRAASCLARSYPGGLPAFIAAMNAKAAELGMARTKFADPTGLSAENVSTATDLAKLVEAAANYPLIREWSTASSHFVVVEPTGRVLGFNNTNALVRNAQWDIQLSKTGYIREAGRCLAMMVNIASKPFVIVLLDSVGRRTRLGDAARVKSWLEAALVPKATAAGRPVPVRAAPDKAKPKERVTGNFQPQRASNADGSVASIQPGGSR